MARRDSDSGIPDNANSPVDRLTFKSNSHETIQVEINKDTLFVCYPYEIATIDGKDINKIQEYVDKGLLLKVGK